jgi:hypothetical protein
MYQRDYILRMIEMIAQLIAGILKLIRSGDVQQASKALQSAYGLAFQHEAIGLKEIPEEKLLDNLLNGYYYTTGHLEMLSDLFFAEAELSMAEKKIGESRLYYKKTLVLLNYIDKEYRSYSQERQNRILAIKEILADESLKD